VNEEDRTKELCRYRLEQANEALTEAELLRDSKHFRGAINRAYYAMFYAIQALVVLKKAETSKHTGAIAFFDRQFVKSDVFDKKFSKWLHRIFDLRQDSDYGDMFEPSEMQCKEEVQHAKDFVQGIREYFEDE